jgi:hypothetical protein
LANEERTTGKVKMSEEVKKGKSEEEPAGLSASNNKGISVGISEHPLYGLGVKLLVNDINGNKSELFLNVDEAINFAGRFNSVANLAFVLGQIAGMMAAPGVAPGASPPQIIT